MKEFSKLATNEMLLWASRLGSSLDAPLNIVDLKAQFNEFVKKDADPNGVDRWSGSNIYHFLAQSGYTLNEYVLYERSFKHSKANIKTIMEFTENLAELGVQPCFNKANELPSNLFKTGEIKEHFKNIESKFDLLPTNRTHNL